MDKYRDSNLWTWTYRFGHSPNFLKNMDIYQVPTLPIETVISMYPHEAITEEELQDQLLRRIESLLVKLTESRLQAKNNIMKTQDKQKARHDQSHRIESYLIGNKVLLERSSLLMSYSTKLESKFTGPYYVHDVCGNSTYKLRTISGITRGQLGKTEKVLKKAMRGNRLKRYVEPLVERTLKLINTI